MYCSYQSRPPGLHCSSEPQPPEELRERLCTATQFLTPPHSVIHTVFKVILHLCTALRLPFNPELMLNLKWVTVSCTLLMTICKQYKQTFESPMYCHVSSIGTCQMSYLVISNEESTLIKGPAIACRTMRWKDNKQFSLILPLKSPILRYSLEQKDWDTSNPALPASPRGLIIQFTDLYSRR